MKRIVNIITSFVLAGFLLPSTVFASATVTVHNTLSFDATVIWMADGCAKGFKSCCEFLGTNGPDCSGSGELIEVCGTSSVSAGSSVHRTFNAKFPYMQSNFRVSLCGNNNGSSAQTNIIHVKGGDTISFQSPPVPNTGQVVGSDQYIKTITQ